MNKTQKISLFLAFGFHILSSCASPTPSNLGEAPDFSLPAVGGRTVSLSDYTGSQPVLLYFHMAVG